MRKILLGCAIFCAQMFSVAAYGQSAPLGEVLYGTGSGVTSSPALLWSAYTNILHVGTGTTNPSIVIDGDANSYYPYISFSGAGGAHGYIMDYLTGFMIFRGCSARYKFYNSSDATVFSMDASTAQMVVNGDVMTTQNTVGENFYVNGTSRLGGNATVTGTVITAKVGTADNNYLAFQANNAEAMRITPSGQIAIGTTDPFTYKLAVAGSMIAERIKVKTATAWPDYVFHAGYRLPTLQEVEKFIKANSHLPGMPSAAEVNANGIDVQESQAALLKKLEELTLYVIDADKKIDALQQQINELKKTAASGTSK